MKTTIYYFSSTGNSLQIARIISSEIGNCVIKPITTEISEEPVGGSQEYVGFSFPVFNFGMPRLVKKFIENLNILPETYCFAVITYGGYAANTLGMLEDILLKKNLELSYSMEVQMPKSNASAPGDKIIKRVINSAIGRVIKASGDIANEIKRPVRRKAVCLTNVTNSWLYENIEEYDKKFSVTDQCIDCGLCARICPVNNIIIENRQHIWLHHCEQCLKCLQWCPGEAIQYGRKTTRWKRYHNPDISLSDIFNTQKNYMSFTGFDQLLTEKM
jgi:ferredoxin